MQSFPLNDFATLPRSANDLFASASRSSFFNSASWFDLVAEHGSDPGWHAQLVMANDGKTGMVFRLSQYGPPKTLINAENPYSCCYDVLLRDARIGDVRQFAQRLVTQMYQPHSLLLRGLDPNAGYFHELLDGLRDAGFVAKPYSDWAVWYSDVGGKDFEEYWSTLPSSLRNTWQRKTTALARSTSPSIITYSPQDDIERFVADYDRVQQQSWKRAEPYPAFIANAIRSFARAGVLRMGLLAIDDAPAAAQFWIVNNRQATLFKLVYAENFSKYSPGTLLTKHMIESIIAGDHPHEIDFGRGDDAYKTLWMHSRRERWGIEAANPKTIRGALHGVRILAGQARNAIFNR